MLPEPRPTRVRARANIALVKYWGKADPERNVPAVGSLSLTLAGLETETRIEPAPYGERSYLLDGVPMTPAARARVEALLERAGVPTSVGLRFVSENRFPTAAGLASSAAGGAAAVLAVRYAFDLPWDREELLAEVLRFSGSAPRSLLGGFVRLDPDPGTTAGVRLGARPVPEAWALRVLAVETATGPKALGSREAMERTRRSSPYWRAWVESHAEDLEAAWAAIAAEDLERLLAVTEHSTAKMHAVALAAWPPILYANPVTLAVLEAVRAGRAAGLTGGVTLDAGPHVKLFVRAPEVPAWTERLLRVPGVRRVRELAPGAGPEVWVAGEAVAAPW